MMTTIRKTIRPSIAFWVIWEPHLLPTTLALMLEAGGPVADDRASSTLVCVSGLVMASVWMLADRWCDRVSVKSWAWAVGNPAFAMASVRVGTETLFDTGTVKIDPPLKSMPKASPRTAGIRAMADTATSTAEIPSHRRAGLRHR